MNFGVLGKDKSELTLVIILQNFHEFQPCFLKYIPGKKRKDVLLLDYGDGETFKVSFMEFSFIYKRR